MKEKLIAQMIVTSILSDIQNRKGGDAWYWKLDEETQEAINDEWTQIVIQNIKKLPLLP